MSVLIITSFIFVLFFLKFINFTFPGVLYPNGASHNDIVMETTTDTDEERDAIIKTVKLKNFILGLRNVFEYLLSNFVLFL